MHDTILLAQSTQRAAKRGRIDKHLEKSLKEEKQRERERKP